MAYTPETANEFTVFTFHNGNFIQIVSGAAGMQITSQGHPQADKMSFLLLYLFPLHIRFLGEGNVGTRARRDARSAPSGSPPEGLGHSVNKRPQSGKHILLYLPVTQDDCQIFAEIYSWMSCRPRTLVKKKE